MLMRQGFIGALFGVLLIGELSFQFYTNGEWAEKNIDVDERAALEAILLRSDVLEEKARSAGRAADLEQAKQTCLSLNRRAEHSKEYFQPFTAQIALLDEHIKEAWRPYDDLVEKHQRLVREQFSRRRVSAQSILGRLTGIQYGLSASLLAVGLAFFATLIVDAWKWVLFGASFLAQYTASLMIYHGAMMKFQDERQASAFAVMFFFCAPIAFHFGTMLFGHRKHGESQNIGSSAPVSPPSAHIEFGARTEPALRFDGVKDVAFRERVTGVIRKVEVPIEGRADDDVSGSDVVDADGAQNGSMVELAARELAGYLAAGERPVKECDDLLRRYNLTAKMIRTVKERVSQAYKNGKIWFLKLK